MIAAVAGLNMAPYGLVLEWPYAYIAGNIGTTALRVEKYDISMWPFVLKDFATHATYNSATYYNCRLGVGVHSDKLLCCGGYNDGMHSHQILNVINKADLSNIISYFGVNTNQNMTNAYWIDVMMDNNGDIYLSGSGSAVSPYYGNVIRLNSNHDVQWNSEGIYSTVQRILGFYSSGGNNFIDIAGSYGGNPRCVYRFDKAYGAYYHYGPATDDFYSYSGGCVNGGYYYLVGRYDHTLWYAQQIVDKVPQSLSSFTLIWSKKINPNANPVYQNASSCCSDGFYLYGTGFYYSGTGDAGGDMSKWEKLPITPDFFCYDIVDGALQWYVEGDVGKVPSINSIDHINGHSYFFDILTNSTFGSPYHGWLEMRNKFDGRIADATGYGPGPEEPPTNEELMKGLRWFHNDRDEGFYLGD